jgi:protein gp37
MQETPIGWTDFSVNLIKYRDADGKVVWACVHASEGCRFCYSQALAIRWGRGKEFTTENMKSLTPFFDEKEAKQVLNSKKIVGKKVFVNDMTDWMGPWLDDELIDLCFAVFALRPDVTFQTLTKHADRQHRYFSAETSPNFYPCTRVEKQARAMARDFNLNQGDVSWPLPNVHVGVSVEDQKNAEKRIPLLTRTPAAIRWVSAEPLLGPVDLQVNHPYQTRNGGFRSLLDDLDGIVIGGESGAGHREMPLAEALMLAESARAAGVAVYFKQDSGPRPGRQGRIPDDIWAMKDWPN